MRKPTAKICTDSGESKCEALKKEKKVKLRSEKGKNGWDG
jgi:hypothetical protein